MNRFYRIALPLVGFFFRLVYPLKIVGREHIPEGAALVCGNHSSYADPVMAAIAFTGRHPLHFMAKADLFQKPFLHWVLKKAEAFPVERGKADVAAIRTAMKYLKNGEKVMLFPQGKRVREHEMADAKTGAAMIAIRTGVPIVPMYIVEKRRIFRKNLLVIGKAYCPEVGSRKATAEEYRAVADDLLARIFALGEVTK